jgi:hypothetical protein
MLSPPPDLLAVACPGCHAALAVSSPLFGQAAACPVCGAGSTSAIEEAPRRASWIASAAPENPAPTIRTSIGARRRQPPTIDSTLGR